MNTVVEKIFHGILYGIGFSLVFGGAYYFLTLKMTEEALSLYSFEPESVVVNKHRKIERDNKLLILGKVKNNSDSDAKGVNINVDLYYKDDFVKQCSELINGNIQAGKTRNFEMSCGGGCKNKPIVKHDSYKIYVTGF
jgi:hypothetical protein